MSTIAAIDCQSHSPHTIVPRAAEFADVWLDDITNLYVLSFLLTADKVLAEQCFSDAMMDYVGGSPGFADWANGPGKVAVIRRAYQTIRPVPKRVHSWSFAPGAKPLLSAAHQPFSTITALGAFERFVFVLSVLEGTTDDVCADLLECELGDITDSRDLANRLVAALELDDALAEDSVIAPVTTTLISQHSGLCQAEMIDSRGWMSTETGIVLHRHALRHRAMETDCSCLAPCRHAGLEPWGPLCHQVSLITFRGTRGYSAAGSRLAPFISSRCSASSPSSWFT